MATGNQENCIWMWESEFTAPNSLIPIPSLSTQSSQFLQTIQFKCLQQFQDQA